MELSAASPWNTLFAPPRFFPHQFIPENYVHWTQTPESHVYSADLPGVRKEEIRVELEDSKYLIIRTEAAAAAANEPTAEAVRTRRSFMRKFRLPEMIDINNISAGYEDGMLTVRVPRAHVRRGFFIDPADIPERVHVLARAA